MPFFKYMGIKAAKSFLKEQTVRFCQPNSYNDPFELLPEVKVKDNCLKLKKNLEVDISGGVSELHKYEISDSELGDYKYHLNTDLISEVSKNIGITCFSRSKSRVPVNLLMWAHYSESHQGIVIQLKNDSDLVKDLTQVLYRKTRPVIDGELFDRDSILLKDLYVKSAHWEYESEYRLAKKLDDCEDAGGGVYVCEISPQNIERVILGVNSSQKLKSLALEFSTKFNVQVILTKPSGSGFGFEASTVFGGEYADVINVSEWYNYESTKI